MISNTALPLGACVGRRVRGLGFFADLGKGIQVESISDSSVTKVFQKNRNIHSFYRISEHFLLCELSGDYKQHSSHTCAVVGFGVSEALKYFYNVCLF